MQVLKGEILHPATKTPVYSNIKFVEFVEKFKRKNVKCAVTAMGKERSVLTNALS